MCRKTQRSGRGWHRSARVRPSSRAAAGGLCCGRCGPSPVTTWPDVPMTSLRPASQPVLRCATCLCRPATKTYLGFVMNRSTLLPETNTGVRERLQRTDRADSGKPHRAGNRPDARRPPDSCEQASGERRRRRGVCHVGAKREARGDRPYVLPCALTTPGWILLRAASCAAPHKVFAWGYSGSLSKFCLVRSSCRGRGQDSAQATAHPSAPMQVLCWLACVCWP